MRGCGARMVMCAMLLAVPAAVSAQQAGAVERWLPDTLHFMPPVADPASARMGVALMATNLLATQGPERPPFLIRDPDDAAFDVVAAIALGVTFPLLRVAQWDDGSVTLYAEGKVFGRFRIEYESRDDMGQDWYVGGGLEGRRGRWSGRAGIVHRSSHLGDEFMLDTGAERIEFGSEQLDVLVARDLPEEGARVYAGGSWIFRSYLDWEPRLEGLGISDRALVQVGGDRMWRPWTDQRLAAWLGFDVQAAERTGWEPGFSVAAGAGIDTGRSARLMLRFYSGPSTMGEFFLTSERYFGVEFLLEGW